MEHLTCKCKATCNVAAEDGNLLSSDLTPTCVISYHSDNWSLEGRRTKEMWNI